MCLVVRCFCYAVESKMRWNEDNCFCQLLFAAQGFEILPKVRVGFIDSVRTFNDDMAIAAQSCHSCSHSDSVIIVAVDSGAGDGTSGDEHLVLLGEVDVDTHASEYLGDSLRPITLFKC